ncbi:MAG TPA: pYEATS domain-containing protein [Pyrinomonadaceae bacterium]|nr:pYEATS domain-containing protein [Pyrinomonadaceae bacterium]
MQNEYRIASELIRTVVPKRFKEKGRLHFYVRIYLEASADALDRIELVKYTLHPTFVDRVRVSTARQGNFEIRIWTYGYFEITASIVIRDGFKTDVRGYVEWEVPEGFVLEDDAS